MALLTAQAVVKTGLAPVYSAVSASDTVTPVPGSKLFLHVKNGNGSACTAATNPTVSVPASTGDRMIGPLPAEMADPATGLITVQYSVTATVTAALVVV